MFESIIDFDTYEYYSGYTNQYSYKLTIEIIWRECLEIHSAVSPDFRLVL